MVFVFKWSNITRVLSQDCLLLNKFNNLLYWCQNSNMSTTKTDEINEYLEASKTYL